MRKSVYAGQFLCCIPMFVNCSHEVSKTLEDPDPDLFRRSWAGLYYRERGQRCRRHLDLLVCRGPVRPHAAVDHGPGDFGADCGPGDCRAHGGSHWQGPERPHPRRIRPRLTFFMMLAILIVNFGNVVTEFAGIAGSLELFGLSKYVTVPICAVIVWLIV